MQEEVENRSVNLAISTSRLTARTVISAVQMYLRHRREASITRTDIKPYGKQTVKDLIGQDQGVANIDIAKTDLKGFERVARKYGIDYAIRKDASARPQKYLVFFKSKDADAMTAAFNEYSQKALRKEERPSVLEQIKKYKALVAALPGKVINRDKQREKSR